MSKRTSSGLLTYTKMIMRIVQENETISIDKIFEIVYKEINGADGDVHKDFLTHTSKNVHRRLGDVLNSLAAIGMISKEGRIVKWLGYPNCEEEEVKKLKDEKQKLEECIQEKTKSLESQTSKSTSLKRLIHMNKFEVKEQQQGIVDLPFIAIKTDKRTNVECSVSSDGLQYLFNFDRPFEILDNMEVLQKMDLTSMNCNDLASNLPSLSPEYE